MPTDQLRQLVAAAVQKHGASRVARLLGISTDATLNFGIGGRIHKGTAALVRENETKLAALLEAA